MSTEDNKDVVRRFLEAANTIMGNTAIVDEVGAKFYKPEAIIHQTTGDMTYEQYIQYVAGMFSAFPDTKFTIEDMVAEDDKVAARVTWRGTHQGELRGIPPTGKNINVPGVSIYRIADGKFAEVFSFTDTLGMMQQLGVIPTS